MYFSGIADEAGEAIEVQIEAHQRLGWRHIELRNVSGVNFTQVDENTFEHIAGLLAEAELEVSCFASAIANWARKISGDFQVDVDDLKRAAPRMRRLGTAYIRVMSYPNDGLAETEYRTEVLRRLRELTRIAEGEGVVLMHENCEGYGGRSGQHAMELLAEINSPAFQLLYDTANPIQHQLEPWPFYQATRRQVSYVHIKDGKPLPDGKHQITWCGEGDCRVREVLTDLFAQGYDGGISIEPHLAAIVHEGRPAGEGAAEIYVEYGRRLEQLVAEARRPAQA